VVAFEAERDGSQIKHLALLEAKMNMDRFPSFRAAKDRITKVTHAINSTSTIPLSISVSETRDTIHGHRRLAGHKVILFYAANNVDDATAQECYDHDISVILPNGSNLDVQFAPSIGFCFGRDGKGGSKSGALEDEPAASTHR
jgi:hypothetical protein